MRLVTVVILLVALTGAIPVEMAAQCDSIDRGSPEAVRQEVLRIYNTTLDEMQYTLPSGVNVITWRPPSEAVHAQIKCIGSAAVPALSELFATNDRSFGRLLAIQMLGWIGGPEIVSPLARVLSRSGDFLITKTAALESLVAAPADKALPVVLEVLRTDSNPEVRRKAASVAERLRSAGKE